MTEIVTQWKNYMELGKLVVNGQLVMEEFEKQIIIFSSFLCESNRDYHYNATYLPNYVEEFLCFLKCFYSKYPLVEQLFKMASDYADVTLIIDCYWQQESIWDREQKEIFVTHKVHPSYERKGVCDEELSVDCSVLRDTKRFIYHSKTGTDLTEIQQLLHSLEGFLKKKSLFKIDE